MPESPRYIWFGPATAKALRDDLNAAQEPVLIVRGQGEHMTLEVAEDGQAFEGDRQSVPARVLNEAHPCPPFCR